MYPTFDSAAGSGEIPVFFGILPYLILRVTWFDSASGPIPVNIEHCLCALSSALLRRDRCAAAQRSECSVRVNATLLHPLVTSSVLWDHRAYGAVRHVHSFFPYYNVTDARTESAETRLKDPPMTTSSSVAFDADVTSKPKLKHTKRQRQKQKPKSRKTNLNSSATHFTATISASTNRADGLNSRQDPVSYTHLTLPTILLV